ncbi:hypothetical protein E2C01_071888 [Portunus trituberculatus]|uniref:Uncharacterized protein n=1 Tax=Portunus trituberculatus TaxID=210409 RepID=A0A5B7I5N6_PORTR|nr:hypothetical protein [Portunus trituberculatus]
MTTIITTTITTAITTTITTSLRQQTSSTSTLQLFMSSVYLAQALIKIHHHPQTCTTNNEKEIGKKINSSRR